MLIRRSEVVLKGFSKTPRSNLYIEILRYVSLLILIIGHSGMIGDTKHLGFAMHSLVNILRDSFGVPVFAAITGIFTIGKGKEYFLRNFSRFVFVFIMAMIICLIFKNTLKDESFISYGTMFSGGPYVWYIWGIAFVSIFFPFIKIDKLLLKFPLTSSLIAFCMSFGGSAISIDWFQFIRIVLLGLSAYIFYFNYTNSKIKNKKVHLLIAMFVLLAGNIPFSMFVSGTGWFGSIIVSFLIIVLNTIVRATPKWFNFVIRNSYFVYELHFYFQVVWMYILKHYFNDWDISQNHVYFSSVGMFFAYFGFVFLGSSFGSLLVSQIQMVIWEKMMNKALYKTGTWSKLYWVIVIVFSLGYICFWVLSNIPGIL